MIFMLLFSYSIRQLIKMHYFISLKSMRTRRRDQLFGFGEKNLIVSM